MEACLFYLDIIIEWHLVKKDSEERGKEKRRTCGMKLCLDSNWW